MKIILKRYEKFSTLVELPTGAGKTMIAVKFCLKVLKDGAKVLWLADRIALLTQAVETFARYHTEEQYLYQFICGRSNENPNVFKKYEAKENSTSTTDEIMYKKIEKISSETNMLFASVGTIVGVCSKDKDNGNAREAFRQWIETSQKGKQKLYIIYDEAHHTGAEKIDDFFEALLCQPSESEKQIHFYTIEKFGLIGLTATVYRGDSSFKKFNSWYKDGYDKKTNTITSIGTKYGDCQLNETEKLLYNRITATNIKDLIKDGFLVKPNIIKVDEFKHAKPANQDDEVKYLANRIKQRYKEWGKTIVIVNNIDMAEQLKNVLESLEVSCLTYTSKNEDNKIKLKQYKAENNNSIMISVNMLNEGINIPDLNTLYLYAPTKSQIVLRQRIGRVLRKAADQKPKDARVIWQYYPDSDVKLGKDEFESLLKAEFNYNVQSDAEIEALFDENALKSDRIGCFFNSACNDSEYYIYVLGVEREGYMQYWRMLQNDWDTLPHFKGQEYDEFQKYADCLNIDEKSLLKEIKKICFYLSKVKRAELKGRQIKKRIFVNDEDIKIFYKWFRNGKIAYCSIPKSENNQNSEKEKEGTEESHRDNANEENTEQDAVRYEGNNSKLLKDAIQKMWEDKKKEDKKREECQPDEVKQYTDLLTYGSENNKLYQELESLGFILQMGAVKNKRITITVNSNKIEMAFAKITDKGIEKGKEPSSHRCRNDFGEEDFLFIASTLVNIPNHIRVAQDDVDEYKDKLIKNIHKTFTFDVKKDIQAVQEFLMALGYAYNTEVIKMQCKRQQGVI